MGKARTFVTEQGQQKTTNDLRSREAAVAEREAACAGKEKRLQHWEENLARRETQVMQAEKRSKNAPASHAATTHVPVPTTRAATRRMSGAMDIDECTTERERAPCCGTQAPPVKSRPGAFTIFADAPDTTSAGAVIEPALGGADVGGAKTVNTANTKQADAVMTAATDRAPKSSADIISGVRRAKQVLAQVNAAPSLRPAPPATSTATSTATNNGTTNATNTIASGHGGQEAEDRSNKENNAPPIPTSTNFGIFAGMGGMVSKSNVTANVGGKRSSVEGVSTFTYEGQSPYKKARPALGLALNTVSQAGGSSAANTNNTNNISAMVRKAQPGVHLHGAVKSVAGERDKLREPGLGVLRRVI